MMTGLQLVGEALKTLRKGEVVCFDACFTLSELRSSGKITQLQGDTLRYQEPPGLDMHRKHPVLICKRKISSGTRIRIGDLRVVQMELKDIQPTATGDIWVVLDRPCNRTLQAGDNIDFGDVIPHWKKVFFGIPEQE